tara:strand:- start:25 stop:447 length:423 start_codon:yes stop_codon:yes gene_type:complete
MFPVDHNFHSFLSLFEDSVRKHSKTEKQKSLVDLIIFRLKSQLFKAEAKGMSFLLPVLKTENELMLYMIPNIKEVEVGSMKVNLKAKDPIMKELEMIAVIYSYCQNGDICFDSDLSQVLCSCHTSYEQKLTLLAGSSSSN